MRTCLIPLDTFRLPADQIVDVVVAAMTATELRECIVGPAQEEGVTVAERFIRLLLDEFHLPTGRIGHGDPGALPLLARALSEAWLSHRGTQLTARSYLKRGGLLGTAQRLVAETHQRLRLSPAVTWNDAVRHLAQVAGEDHAIRRALPIAELHARTHTTIGGSVLDELVNSRLLSTERSTIQITHDLVLNAWYQLAMFNQ